jgi:hypothetical protein
MVTWSMPSRSNLVSSRYSTLGVAQLIRSQLFVSSYKNLIFFSLCTSAVLNHFQTEEILEDVQSSMSNSNIQWVNPCPRTKTDPSKGSSLNTVSSLSRETLWKAFSKSR